MDRQKKTIRTWIITIIGVLITAAAISIFYVPNKIVNGGVSGASTILYYEFGIKPAISFAVINLILIILGYKILGKEFIVKTVICAGILSIFIDIFDKIPPLTDNIFLASIFGATLYGIGIGITFAEGASTGGTDILSRLIQYKFPYLPIGKILLAVDAVIIITSLILFKNIDLALYGVISLCVSTYAVDWLIRKLNISKLAFVITDKGSKISEYLVSTSPRGVTQVDVYGTYSGSDKKMLICALKDNELPDFQRKILEIDENAFTIFSESQQIVGEGFNVYK